MSGAASEAERLEERAGAAAARSPSPSRSQPSLAIQTEGLTKRFGHQLAVNDVDLAVPAGSVFGFLGPNGSGKTTSIRVLLGLAAASDGHVSVLGGRMPESGGRVLPRVGALVEGPAFYPFLSGADNLRRLDSADREAPRGDRGARVEQALDRVGLTAAAGKRVRAYSLGMKQRLGIAAALLRPRDLLVLDEPTNGLDPQGTREVRSLIKSLADDGTTVFVSSHLLAEVEQICTHVGVMSSGRLVAQGTLDDLRRAGRSRVTVLTPDAGLAAEVLARHGLAVSPGARGGVLTADIVDGPGDAGGVGGADGAGGVGGVGGAGGAGRATGVDGAGGVDGASGAEQFAPESLVAALVAAGVRVRGFAVDRATLEERFVALTGEGFDVAS